MSNTFFVHLPSNSTDYPENAPNKFRVRLPRPLRFNGTWVVGLHSITFAYSWPSTLGTLDDQAINIHFTVDNNKRQRVLRIPVPKASHTKIESLREFLAATLKHQSESIESIGKSDYQYVSPPRIETRRKRSAVEDLKSPPRIDEEDLKSPPRIDETFSPKLPEDEEIKKAKLIDDAKSKSIKGRDLLDDLIGSRPKEGEKNRAEQFLDKIGLGDKNEDEREEAKKRDEEEKKKREEEEQVKRREEEKKREEEEKKKKREEEEHVKRREEQEKKREEEEKKKREEEAKKKREEEAKKRREEEEKKKQEGEAKKRQEEEKKKRDDEEKKRQEEEKKREEAKKRREEEEKKRREEEDKKNIEAEQETVPLLSPPLENANELLENHEEVEREQEPRQDPVKSSLLNPTNTASRLFSVLLGSGKDEAEPDLGQIRQIIDSVEFQYHKDFDRFKALFTDSRIDFISLSPQLGYVLGFENPQYVVNNEIAKYGCDLRGGFSSFAVYSKGLIEPSIIGNTLSSLLRVVSITGAIPGEYTEKIYDTPIFARVMPKEVSEIEIELRTMDNGRLVPFSYGTVMAVLIFKKTINF